jgi:hypothetical protein
MVALSGGAIAASAADGRDEALAESVRDSPRGAHDAIAATIANAEARCHATGQRAAERR